MYRSSSNCRKPVSIYRYLESKYACRCQENEEIRECKEATHLAIEMVNDGE